MRTRTTVAAGMLAGLLLLAACGGTDTTGAATAGGSAASSGSPAPSAARDGFNDADVAFVAGMKPHHEQAVEMADMVLSTDPSPPVAALAERIKADQQPEIDQLDDMLDRFGAGAAVEGGHGDHGDHGAGPAMARHGGMMTDGQMQAMADATGDDASRMFLTMMIEHHEGAIAAAETELQDGEHQPAIDLAVKIRDGQAAEIAQMERLLADL